MCKLQALGCTLFGHTQTEIKRDNEVNPMGGGGGRGISRIHNESTYMVQNYNSAQWGIQVGRDLMGVHNGDTSWDISKL